MVSENKKRKLRGIEDYIFELEKITSILVRYSSVIFFMLLLSTIITLMLYQIRVNDLIIYKTSLERITLSLLGLIFPLLGIIILFRFTQLTKKGMVYYEEVADEFEWGEVKRNRERGPFEIRIITKSFLKATDVPIIKGNLGMTTYFLLFFLLISLNSMLFFK